MNRFFRISWNRLWYVGIFFYTATALLWGHVVIESLSIRWAGVFSDAGLMRLYGSDIFFLVAFLAGIKSGELRNAIKSIPVVTLIGFLIVMAVGSMPIFFSGLEPILAAQELVRVFQGGVIVLMLIALFQSLQFLTLLRAALLLGAVGTLHAIVGIAQVIKESSVGGILYYMGEPRLSLMLDGVAKISVPNETTMLRAYGLLSHPNMLGGVLVVTFIVLCMYYVFRSRSSFMQAAVLACIAIQGAGLLVTFSRTAWLATFMGIVSMIVAKGYRVQLPVAALFVGIFFATAIPGVRDALLIRTEMSPSQQFVVERVQFSSQSFALWKQAPFFGVGAGQTVPAMIEHYGDDPSIKPWQYTYAHAVPIVMLTEYGIIGMIGFLLMLAPMGYGLWRIRTLRFSMLASIVVMSPLLLFDHYLWTQQPGRVLLWGTVGTLLGIYVALVRIYKTGKNTGLE